MKCLITGGTGFLGSKLSEVLFSSGHELVLLGKTQENNPQCHHLYTFGLEKINWYKPPFKNIDVVFHLAANNNTTDLNERDMMETNYFQPIKMLHEAAYAGCKKFIIASTCAVYGNSPTPFIEASTPLDPLNLYAQSKALLEKAALGFQQATGNQVVLIRFCNIYGPGEEHKGRRASMIYQLCRQMLIDKLRPSLFKNGEQQRDYIYIDDAANLLAKAAQSDKSGIFNGASGNALSFNRIVKIVNDFFNTDLQPNYIDNPYGGNYQSNTLCDITATQAAFNWTPELGHWKAITTSANYWLTKHQECTPPH